MSTAGEYEAARGGAALASRSDRTLLRMFGRDPVRMLGGLVTNDVAGLKEGEGTYAAMLTPKGRMVADLRVFRRPEGDLLIDIPTSAAEEVRAHLARFVPPLFARVEDFPASVLGVYGPRSREVLEAALGVELPEGGAQDEVHPVGGGGLAVRSAYTGDEGYELILEKREACSVWPELLEAGAKPIGEEALEVLRIEAGTPRWGAELDQARIPLEAGLRERAISESKGCYTGQEVIVRILHRGHVNWLLRGFLLGDGAVPAPGAELTRPGEEKVVARLTSACHSPRHGQVIALGYARREIEPPASLELADPERAAAPDGESSARPPARGALVVGLPFGEPPASVPRK